MQEKKENNNNNIWNYITKIDNNEQETWKEGLERHVEREDQQRIKEVSAF